MRRMPGSVADIVACEARLEAQLQHSSLVIGEVPPCSKCPVSFLVLSAIIGPVARLP